MDPGAFALLGSVSFFAGSTLSLSLKNSWSIKSVCQHKLITPLSGVTRLTMSLTVIMVEITNDIHQLLLIMITM